MINKDVYKMKLHEIITVRDFIILRVPGGWIYYSKGKGTSTFIRFDNEFQKLT